MTMPTDRPDEGLRAKLTALRDEMKDKDYREDGVRGAYLYAVYVDRWAAVIDTLLAQASAEPSSPTPWTVDGSMPLPTIAQDAVKSLDVAAMWNRWRCDLPADRPFAHSNGVAFLNALNELPAVPLPGAAAPSASAIEVRYATLENGEQEFDEIVASNCDVHLEKMDEGLFYLGVETADEYAKFWISAKTGEIGAMEYDRGPLSPTAPTANSTAAPSEDAK